MYEYVNGTNNTIFTVNWVHGMNSNHPNMYFTNAQLFAPTGSLNQIDIAKTATSIDASSPSFILWNLE